MSDFIRSQSILFIKNGAPIQFPYEINSNGNIKTTEINRLKKEISSSGNTYNELKGNLIYTNLIKARDEIKGKHKKIKIINKIVFKKHIQIIKNLEQKYKNYKHKGGESSKFKEYSNSLFIIDSKELSEKHAKKIKSGIDKLKSRYDKLLSIEQQAIDTYEKLEQLDNELKDINNFCKKDLLEITTQFVYKNSFSEKINKAEDCIKSINSNNDYSVNAKIKNKEIAQKKANLLKDIEELRFHLTLKYKQIQLWESLNQGNVIDNISQTQINHYKKDINFIATSKLSADDKKYHLLQLRKIFANIKIEEGNNELYLLRFNLLNKINKHLRKIRESQLKKTA